MIRRLTLVLAAAALAVLFVPAARAGQEEGMWEFHPFGAKAALDDQEVLAKERSLSGGGTFRRSADLDDNFFAGLRLGYVWSPNLQTELVYDRNHTGGDYVHTISGVEEVRGRISAVLTSYQFGGLYHPLGKWRTSWQPFVALSAGYMDVDVAPSAALAGSLGGSDATVVYRLDLPHGDHNWLVGYGVGCKYFLRSNVALRAEIRAKSYELFSERRDDREISLGISFFAPGATF